MSNNEVCEFADVLAIRETEKALLVNVENEEVWIPKSQIEESSEVAEVGDCGVLEIPQWLAEKAGLV